MYEHGQVKNKIIELLEQFNETGDIDITSLVKVVEKSLLTKKHVYLCDATGTILDLGDFQTLDFTIKNGKTHSTVESIRDNAKPLEALRNLDGQFKSGPTGNRFIKDK